MLSRLWNWFFPQQPSITAPAPYHVCIDRYLPDDAEAEIAVWRGSAGTATGEQSRGAALSAKLWTPGQTLRVHFLDGHPTLCQKVARFAQIWTQHANLHFAFDDYHKDTNSPQQTTAEIRVTFTQPGSWSYIGTDALQVAPTEPTINFGWLTLATPNDEVQRVVLHEFGHAIGLVHEHQHPEMAIPWNQAAVYDYYGGPPNYWSREQVDYNLFQRYATEQTQFSTFDPASIMLYPVPAEFTDGHFSTSWNQTLSATDQAFIASCYPFA